MGNAGRKGGLTRITVRNLKISVAQLLITEAVVIYPAVHQHDRLALLAPISFLTVAPIWALQERAFGAFLVILSINIAFLSVMIFSITKNHTLVSGISLFLFNFLGVCLFAAGY
jgi:hypothetical protein